ncbi:17777_t:CDS:2 [Dentiscutata erythropus]|uniref:17777_t:CDS:1 n=1 Tax=Dentiscutata erythropus TaxID=1348616 RepID=A0A9N9FU83_9GLOM|nr:17777_t:CDS:2 [Dentiscutata erythropus]
MLCYVNTIVKISQVCQSDKEESKLTVVWAIGLYPVGSEEREIEMVLFILMVDYDRDPNSQSVFVKNEYYSVGKKAIPGSYNNNLRLKITVVSFTHLVIRRDLGSNRCLLKVSLVGVIQDAAQEINDENAMVKVLVKDYVGQSSSFIVRVIFPYHNNRFKYLLNSVRPYVSVLFVIGLMEVIHKELYVYAVETSYIDSCFLDKKKVNNSNDSQSSLVLYKSIHSRLLAAHNDVSENSSEEINDKRSNQRGEVDQSVSESSVSNSYSSKRVRVEDKDPNHVDSDYIEDECEFNKGSVSSIDSEENVTDNFKTSERNISKANREGIPSIVHNTRKRSEMLKNVNGSVVAGEYKKN